MDGHELDKKDIDVIKEKLESWKKVGASGAIGVGAGIGTTAVVKSLLVPATLWNSSLNIFGLGSGVLLSSAAFSAATTLLPLTVGGALFVGSMFVFDKREKRNFSRFLADVIISSMPMIHADGEITDDEMAMVKRLASHPEIHKADCARIMNAIGQCNDIDYVCNNFLMHEKKSEKALVKARLLLSIAWEIAKSDGKIHSKEIELHDNMAKIFNVERNYTKEVRLILTPEFAPA